MMHNLLQNNNLDETGGGNKDVRQIPDNQNVNKYHLTIYNKFLLLSNLKGIVR